MLSNFHYNYITIIRGENIARDREKHKTIKQIVMKVPTFIYFCLLFCYIT